MKKLGVCVRYITDNYGSMLQLFALQKAIEELKWDYEFIVYDKKTLGFIIKNSLRVFNPYFMNGKMLQLKKKKLMKKYPDIQSKNQKRLEAFETFRKKHFHHYSEVFKGYKALQKGAERYDAVLVGSDQLWGPEGLDTNFFNLMFVPEEICKVAYSTSFGIKDIPDSLTQKYREYLQRIEFISVREQSGQEIVRKTIGKEVPVVVDPVMLLSKKQWETFIPDSIPSVQEPYILCYFLGSNPLHREAAKQLQGKTGLKIVTLPHIDEVVKADIDFGDIQLFDTSPEDFLNLIRHSSYICTDSFHGTAFSIINEKPFTVFDRFDNKEKVSRNTRIDTICDIFGLKSRRFNGNIMDSFNQPIDYQKVRQTLGSLRKDAWSYLENALMQD